MARCLFRLLVDTFVPGGSAIIGLGDMLERRWGAEIPVRGIYRSPTRSSHGHFVKASGLRWLTLTDRRRIRQLVRPGLGFAPMPTARRTLADYEAMTMIRKGQAHNIGGRGIRAQAIFVASLFHVAA